MKIRPNQSYEQTVIYYSHSISLPVMAGQQQPLPPTLQRESLDFNRNVEAPNSLNLAIISERLR